MDRCDLQSRATQTTQTLHGDKLDHARSKSVYPSVMQVDPRQGLAVPELPRSKRKGACNDQSEACVRPGNQH